MNLAQEALKEIYAHPTGQMSVGEVFRIHIGVSSNTPRYKDREDGEKIREAMRNLAVEGLIEADSEPFGLYSITEEGRERVEALMENPDHYRRGKLIKYANGEAMPAYSEFGEYGENDSDIMPGRLHLRQEAARVLEEEFDENMEDVLDPDREDEVPAR